MTATADRSINRVEGSHKVTGAAHYTADVTLPGQVHAVLGVPRTRSPGERVLSTSGVLPGNAKKPSIGELPPSDLADHSWYVEVRDRHSYAFALVSVAAGLRITDGVIISVALARGAVAAAALATKGPKPLAQNAFKVDLGRHSVVRALSVAARIDPEAES